MIMETKGMFLNVPSPMQITMNVCSHFCHYCTTPDTLILQPNLKAKEIGTLMVGDIVLGWNGDRRMSSENRAFRQTYRMFTESKITAINKRKAEVFEVRTTNGIVKCTADHNWFMGRVGKYEYQPLFHQGQNGTISKLTRLNLHIDDFVMSDNYKIGYIKGFCDGDGTWMPQKSWRIACKDIEPIERIINYFEDLGYSRFEMNMIQDEMFCINTGANSKETNLINDVDIINKEYYRGYLSGIFDAEGTKLDKVNRKSPSELRIAQYKNENPLVYDRIKYALRLFNFGYVAEPKGVRVVGGMSEAARFIKLVMPSIKRKSTPLLGWAHKGMVEKVEIISIKSIGVQDVVSLSTETGNYIANGFLSSNCFANNNKPDRRFEEMKTFNQLTRYKTHKTLLANFLQAGYPVMASNLVDVFAKNNYKHFLQMYKLFRSNNIPLLFQTRGGYGTDEVLKTLPKSYFYISFTSHDDKVIKHIEPNAPSITERLEFIKKLHAFGHNIEIGINPYLPEHCDIEKVLQMTRDYTNMYWVNNFHMNNNQKRNLTTKGLQALDPYLKKNDEQKEEELKKAFETFLEYGVVPSGYSHFTLVDRRKLFDCYEHTLPTTNDFLVHITETKNEGDSVTFEDYYNYFSSKFPKWMDRFDSGYLVSVKRDYSNLRPNYNLRELLKFHWDNYLIAESSILTRTLSIYPFENDMDKNGQQIFTYIHKPLIHTYIK